MRCAMPDLLQGSLIGQAKQHDHKVVPGQPREQGGRPQALSASEKV